MNPNNSCQHCGQKISDSYNILNDLSFIDSKCLQSIYHEHSNEQDEDTRAVYQYLLNQVMYCSNCKNTMSNNNWDAKGCSVNPICLNCKIYQKQQKYQKEQFCILCEKPSKQLKHAQGLSFCNSCFENQLNFNMKSEQQQKIQLKPNKAVVSQALKKQEFAPNLIFKPSPWKIQSLPSFKKIPEEVIKKQEVHNLTCVQCGNKQICSTFWQNFICFDCDILKHEQNQKRKKYVNRMNTMFNKYQKTNDDDYSNDLNNLFDEPEPEFIPNKQNIINWDKFFGQQVQLSQNKTKIIQIKQQIKIQIKPKSQQKESNYCLRQCKICLSQKSSIINTACRHLMMCLLCYEKMKVKNENKQIFPCPYCCTVGRYTEYIEPIYI